MTPLASRITIVRLWRLALLLLGWSMANWSAATTLPVGPITFGTDASYDSSFKEPPTAPFAPILNGLSRNAAGYLFVNGLQSSLALYDTAATGGFNGLGGTGGGDANKDLSDFTVSADFANSLPGIGGGFLLRFNSSEANGYAAGVHSLDPFAVQFDLYEGANQYTAGLQIFSQVAVFPAGFSVAANTFYEFKVTVSGGTFKFDFAHGKATANFTDFTVSATSGQVGIEVDTLAPNTYAELDNFKITAVPEPSGMVLAALGLAALSAVRAKRARRSRR